MSWVGFDFDGTLVEFPGPGQSYGPDVPLPVSLMRGMVNAGVEVRVVTAKAAYPELHSLVRGWLDGRGFHNVSITDKKDFEMVALFDDLAISIKKGCGELKTDIEYANAILKSTGFQFVPPPGEDSEVA